MSFILGSFICYTPFGGLLPLIFFYYEFYIAQDLLREFACRRSERVYHVRGVKFINIPEIVVIEIVGSIKPAA
ncbi:MAG: hypothetical protein FWF15_00135 [Oscillospiraceae bacterium]|nr:hypothetical protein [Oscillospiraceae bacterium]